MFLAVCYPSFTTKYLGNWNIVQQQKVAGKAEEEGSINDYQVSLQTIIVGFQSMHSHLVALAVCMVCVKWSESFQSTHCQVLVAINVKLRNKMCKKGYIHMHSPNFCQPLVLV